MRIAHVIFSLRGGGAETQLRILSNSLVQRGHDVSICCFDDRGREAYQGGVAIYSHRRRSKWSLGPLFAVRRFLVEASPDVVQVWLPASVTIPALIWSRALSIPAIFSFRDKMFFYRPLAVLEFLVAALLAVRVVANNPPQQSWLPYRLLYRAKGGVQISNAVLRQESAERKPSKDAHDPVISFVFAGRIVKSKNWRLLLDAFRMLADRPNWRLDMYGTGDQEGALADELKRHCCADRIHWHGYVDDLSSRLALYDVLLAPSHYEGMPNVVLEACSVGVPCLVSNIPAHRAVLGERYQYYFFDPNSASNLAALLGRVLTGELDLGPAREQGEEIVAEFSEDRMCLQYLDVYESLL